MADGNNHVKADGLIILRASQVLVSGGGSQLETLGLITSLNSQQFVMLFLLHARNFQPQRCSSAERLTLAKL